MKRRNPIRTGPAESIYQRHLRQIARHCGVILPKVPGILSMAYAAAVEDLMRRYADLLTDWAVGAGDRMLQDINRRTAKHWEALSREMGAELRREIRTAPTGDIMRQLLADQVRLITSIPLDAAQRVHDLCLEGIADGTRYNDIADEILRTGEVAESRAVLIARTETSRATTVLTQARAKHIGSDSYIWRTANDGTVRPDHRVLANRVFRWDDPPVADHHSGARAHPGAIYNCRCWPEPILD